MNWKKIVKVTLYIQAAVAIFLAFGMATANITPADMEPVNGRKVAAFAFGFAATLIIVAGKVKNDYRLLLIPLFVTGFNLLDTFYEFFIRNAHSDFAVPM